MNSSTLLKIQDHAEFIKKLSQFIQENPDKAWLLNLIDEPFKLALLIYEAESLDDDHDIAEEIGCNWQTVKQIRSVL